MLVYPFTALPSICYNDATFSGKETNTMVLAVDIGNSNICIGGLAGEAHRDILVTRPRCTADEYAAELRFLLGRLKVDPTACEGVIVCSVVPGLTPVLAHACRRLTGRDALIVSNALDTGLTFAVDEPDRVGRLMPQPPQRIIPCPA
jgi:type III pantothenate kinase